MLHINKSDFHFKKSENKKIRKELSLKIPGLKEVLEFLQEKVCGCGL